MGDTPYSESDEVAFDAIVDTMNAEPLEFVVHVGDIKSSRAQCTDAIYLDRKARFDRSAHPFILAPGDNEWVDCRRQRAGGHDPLERLAKLREIFFSGSRLMGKRQSVAFEAQEGYPENRLWTTRSVVFATLNAQGSNDNVGFDARNDEEAVRRGAANRRWLDRAFAMPNARAVVVIFHANPFVRSKQLVYDALVASLTAHAVSFSKPVLVVHGETHFQRADQPFRDGDGRTIANMTRLESFGSPFVGWVQVSADPADARFFRFRTRGQSTTFP
ncbi:hypothetical protein [Usitatibacter palustris]|uniref:Calcineurin-like phosphoesterase domain-containing protein n=1 Tax=Usitatibacter palustris TaxID=2732487 RepID=A0A6M4H471_9PROT|nr:hypothetical protein [Usitatibacter palustris]QJR14391.1 hypothetical protein DSM104440_01187 [Usitatibacter palustris]